MAGWVCGSTKDQRVTGSQDDVFVRVSKKNISNKLALMGLRPELGSGDPFDKLRAVPSPSPG
jgi:hypothetical protein